MSTADEKTNLPASIPDDGFDINTISDNLIQGARVVCDVTKPTPWLEQPGDIPVDVDRERLIMTSRTANRRWEDDRIVDTRVKLKGQPFTSANELNAAVPKSEWRTGLNGEPVGPW